MKALKGFTYQIILLQCKLPMEELNKPTQFIFIQFILKDLPVFLLSHSNHITFLFEGFFLLNTTELQTASHSRWEGTYKKRSLKRESPEQLFPCYTFQWQSVLPKHLTPPQGSVPHKCILSLRSQRGFSAVLLPRRRPRIATTQTDLPFDGAWRASAKKPNQLAAGSFPCLHTVISCSKRLSICSICSWCLLLSWAWFRCSSF